MKEMCLRKMLLEFPVAYSRTAGTTLSPASTLSQRSVPHGEAAVIGKLSICDVQSAPRTSSNRLHYRALWEGSQRVARYLNRWGQDATKWGFWTRMLGFSSSSHLSCPVTGALGWVTCSYRLAGRLTADWVAQYAVRIFIDVNCFATLLIRGVC